MQLTNAQSRRFRRAVFALHAAKTEVYGTAWKKRGEVLSIIANIARKVDRIERNGPKLREDGEVLVDTVVDLIVYAVKYATYLADTDDNIARQLDLTEEVVRPYSEGNAGFEAVYDRLVNFQRRRIDEDWRAGIVAAFGSLEDCFAGISAVVPGEQRFVATRELIDAATAGIAAVQDQMPSDVEGFLASGER